jgi:hypothetical protein
MVENIMRTHPGNGRIVFTPERCAALAEDWQAGVDASAIMKRLNTMPGMPVRNHKLVWQKASQMGLKRPEGWLLRRKSAPKHNVWTVDRIELLRNLINLVPDADVLEKVNALPGPALKNLESMRRRAQRMGYLAERPRRPGPNQGTWTELRTSFLRENYGRIPPAELLVALQYMPGPAIGSLKTVRSAAVRLGIKSAGLVRTPPAPRASRAARPRPTLATSTPEPEPRPLTAEEQDAIILDKLARIEAQAMKLFSRRESAATVSGSLKIPLREAFRLQAVHREQQKEAA